MSPRTDPAPLTGMLTDLPVEHRDLLMGLAREVDHPGRVRLFEEGGAADRFWIVRTGSVALDIQIPGRGPAVVETIGPGGLLGWSWLCPPREWHLGAETRSPVSAWEFDAGAVSRTFAGHPEFGLAVVIVVARTIGDRLRATRTRLLDLYGPQTGHPMP
ncbi:cyclic nucleotide-binding domain-containing protein [Streptomyces sp. NPDC048664]|uniref:cyclic nucleotide-binding domain-containing protein n=1 Tax=Streptomyces sp. NPDC048664 TaxID=3154505 RepID=UPI0034296E42